MAEIQDFINQVFDQQYQASFGQAQPEDLGRELVLTRQVGDQLAGVLTAKKSLDNYHVTALVVSPDHQGQGLGASLLAELEDQARAEGVTSITLSTKSYQAQGFYLKQGYACYASLIDVPVVGVTKYHLIKRL